jgi:hypothetical protein
MTRDKQPIYTRHMGGFDVEVERSGNVVLAGDDVLVTITNVAALQDALSEAITARDVALATAPSH